MSYASIALHWFILLPLQSRRTDILLMDRLTNNILFVPLPFWEHKNVCWAELKSCKIAFSPKLSILQYYNNIVSWINIISRHLYWFRSQTVKQLVAFESSCTFNVSALCFRHYLPKSLHRIRVSINKQTALCLQFYVVFKWKHLLHAGPVTSWGVPHSKHWALCKACAKGQSIAPTASLHLHKARLDCTREQLVYLPLLIDIHCPRLRPCHPTDRDTFAVGDHCAQPHHPLSSPSASASQHARGSFGFFHILTPRVSKINWAS